MADSNGTGAVGGNAQNIPEAHTPRTRSNFDLKAHRFLTERYGEYTPIFAMESVKEDNLPFRMSHNLLSYTMKKPLMSNVQKVKDLFSVPMECILPLNWEKFYDNPVRGDDVSDDVGPVISHFWSYIGGIMNVLLSGLGQIVSDPTNTDQYVLTAIVRFLVIGEYFYSNGNLLSYLGCHSAPYCHLTENNGLTDDKDWDDLVDSFGAVIFDHVQACIVDDDGVQYNYNAYQTPYSTNGYNVSFRHILSLFRDNPGCYFVSASTDLQSLTQACLSLLQNYSYSFVLPDTELPLNTQFISAYQLCCAHFYSNDHIDFVYSAELYRQLIGHYYRDGVGTVPNFLRNGIRYQYDYLSGHCLEQLLLSCANPALLTTIGGSYGSLLGFLGAYFGFRRSLRYQDYFTGARSQPLAVASSTFDTTVAVQSNTVSVIDISRSIQAQRFLNSINRIGHKFENYLKGLFGGNLPAPDYHNPFHLANVIDTVYGDETANTGDAQINPTNPGLSDSIAITTNLRGSSSKYMFEIQSDRPCVIIAIGHYDVPRVHLTTIDKSFFHANRFDYFNPFMQYIGDQSILVGELGTLPAVQGYNFGYAIRHSEYKQLYHTGAGGFVKSLPGFIFPALDKRGSSYNITPDYIRAVPSEFDHFYTSLTGWSLATYFHFIVDNEIDCSGSRPMSYSPQILG